MVIQCTLWSYGIDIGVGQLDETQEIEKMIDTIGITYIYIFVKKHIPIEIN